jgi:hypothetical protein
MAPAPTRPGIWRLKGGGWFIRARVTHPRTGKPYQLTEVVRDDGVTLRGALDIQDRLRLDAKERMSGKHEARALWSEYAAQLLETKINDGSLASAATHRRWRDTLAKLIPVFGDFYVDELTFQVLVEWREKISGWIRHGMPSLRKRDEGKGVLLKLSPVTANGWLSILKTICTAMRDQFDLDRDPAEKLAYFRVGRTYTREQPNALTAAQVPLFLGKMRGLHPEHYAMTFIGMITGARPSTLRPLRRSGPESDVLWDDRRLLLRRSNALGDAIMDQTKTGLDQEIPLPQHVIELLRAHIDALPEGLMRKSEYLFPSTTGGMRSRSALDKPFRDVIRALGWPLRFTPRGMRRTFQDLAREAQIHDIVTRAISGHATEKMQRHYSTAQLAEMEKAMGRVVSIVTAHEAAPTVGSP